MRNFILKEVQKLQDILSLIQQDTSLLTVVEDIGAACAKSLTAGGKILFVGNGGSASDCQHLAAELVVRLKNTRRALAALALTTDTSALTAIGNDFSFDYIFSRQVEALGQPGDILIAISTSGKSPNVLRAIEAAKGKNMIVVGFTGEYSPEMAAACNLVLNIPSKETAKIQECHITLGHIICALIENHLFPEPKTTLIQDELLTS